MSSYKPMSHEDFKSEAFKIPGIKEGYDSLEEEYKIIEAMIDARKKAGKTQKEVAKLMNTKQSTIARIENSCNAKVHHSPRIGTIMRYAHALGMEIRLQFVERKEKAA